LPRRSAGRDSQASGSMAWHESSRANPRDPRRRQYLSRSYACAAEGEATSSTFLAGSTRAGAHWSSCCMAARKAPMTSPQARGMNGLGRGAWISRCLSKPGQKAPIRRCAGTGSKPEDQMRGCRRASIIAGSPTKCLAIRYRSAACVRAGLSAGGAMAAVMGATYPEIYGSRRRSFRSALTGPPPTSFPRRGDEGRSRAATPA